MLHSKLYQLFTMYALMYAMDDFEEAPVAAFKSVYVDADVAGWFHYAQAKIKRVQKIGLRDAYHTDAEVGDTVRCLLGRPLLPSADIPAAFDDVKMSHCQWRVIESTEAADCVCSQTVDY